MAYEEKNGNVVLTMSQSDYHLLLSAFGIATGALAPKHRDKWLEALDRINKGNPQYSPYMNPGRD